MSTDDVAQKKQKKKLKRMRIQRDRAAGLVPAPAAPKRVPPFTGNLHVLDSAAAWLLVDTLDPNLIPERRQLVEAVRQGYWIPEVNVGAHDLASLKSKLPKAIGEGRYYFLVQPTPDRSVWMECTAVVEQGPTVQ